MVANHCIPAMAFDPRRARMPVVRRKGTGLATEKVDVSRLFDQHIQRRSGPAGTGHTAHRQHSTRRLRSRRARGRRACLRPVRASDPRARPCATGPVLAGGRVRLRRSRDAGRRHPSRRMDRPTARRRPVLDLCRQRRTALGRPGARPSSPRCARRPSLTPGASRC